VKSKLEMAVWDVVAATFVAAVLAFLIYAARQ
jgi:hypothetical protein